MSDRKSNNLVEIINHHYGIRANSITPNYQSNFVYDYFISDNKGKSYYLRYFNAQKNILNNIDELQKIHTILQNCNEFCVPEWILSVDDKATINFRNSSYILLTMLSTGKKTLENWNYNKVLNALSEMHSVLAENLPINNESSFFNFVIPKNQHLNGCFGDTLVSSIDAVINNDRFDYLKSYKRQVIHGDFHSSNVFPGEDNTLNIIDFFNSTFDTPLFDLLELMDLFPKNKWDILNKYNNRNKSQFTTQDFEYLRFVKAVFYLNKMNENIKFNSRLKGGAMTIKWATNIIDNYLYS